ncbi:meteorin-like protein [Haliotis rubra]|uniref:meteorin-like protein n=1 Tax=Haliotis rubra TaxID=36100 RepID=UPI001EE62AD7|nr:meteorin-like protein [Haliotis rubra]
MMHVQCGQWPCTCMLVLVVIWAGSDVMGTACQQCDCMVKDPENNHGGITNIVAACEEGKVTWFTTNGALRITVNPTKSGLFRICFRVESDAYKTVVSQEILATKLQNYRLKTTTQDIKLSPLLTTSGLSKVNCISGSGPTRLYVETESDDEVLTVAKVKVEYDVEKIGAGSSQSPYEVCRLVHGARSCARSVCSSHFVAIGTIDDVTHDEDTSRIRVTASRVISQKEAIFQKPTGGSAGPHELKGVVHAPVRCGIRHGVGQFLFTGRVRLGQAMLQCAPRYEQWRAVLKMAQENGQLECTLDL